jgi:threonine/homoserine/homoserine lactone efflux protein
MPGPLLTVTIAEALRRGFLASVLLVMGHCVLELITVLGLYLGLGKFLKLKPVIGTVTILGGAMLIWMGWGMVPGNVELQISKNSAPLTTFTDNLIIVGALVSVSNPYWILWWVTVGLTLFATFTLSEGSVNTSLIPISAFYFGHISGDIVWYLVVGAVVSSGRLFLSPTVYKLVVQMCGVFLIILGALFLLLVATGRLWNIKVDINWQKH